jgi:hypothetical protein
MGVRIHGVPGGGGFGENGLFGSSSEPKGKTGFLLQHAVEFDMLVHRNWPHAASVEKLDVEII